MYVVRMPSSFKLGEQDWHLPIASLNHFSQWIFIYSFQDFNRKLSGWIEIQTLPLWLLDRDCCNLKDCCYWFLHQADRKYSMLCRVFPPSVHQYPELIVHTDVQTEISNNEGLFSMSSFMLRSSLWVCVLMWLWPPISLQLLSNGKGHNKKLSRTSCLLFISLKVQSLGKRPLWKTILVNWFHNSTNLTLQSFRLQKLCFPEWLRNWRHKVQTHRGAANVQVIPLM